MLIPFFSSFFLLLHFKEALEHGVVAVSADCSVKSAEGDKLLDAITRIPISLFAHILKHAFNNSVSHSQDKCNSNDQAVSYIAC